MISYIVGFKTSEIVDETIFALISMFSLGQPTAVKHDYATYIANKIHEQFMNLDRQRVFKYTAYIYHLLLYYQSDSFPVFLKKLDAMGERKSVIFWTLVFYLVQESPYSYYDFIDLFIYPATCLLSTTPPARLSYDMQKILQLSKNYKIGDWYFFQHHTVIRIYGCELCCYRLPRYVPMRLFALEYFRQFINSDLTYFHSTKKKAQLKFKDQLGPFVMNKKEGWQDIDHILSEKLKLKRSFWWVPYDPFGFINARKIKYRLSAYDHCKIPEIEQFSNQDDWVEGTLVEQFIKEEKMEQTMKNLEKTLDLDSFGQVSLKLP